MARYCFGKVHADMAMAMAVLLSSGWFPTAMTGSLYNFP